MTRCLLRVVAGAVVVLGVAACETDRTAVERGEALFHDPGLSTSETNFVSCATCHSTGETAADSILSGGSLVGVTSRPTYWGGSIRDLRDSVNACLRFFMRYPSTEVALSIDNPEGLDLLAYLESLGTEPSDPVAFTIPRDIAVPDALPPGDPTAGEITYRAACRQCHGDRTSGAHRLVPQAAVIPTDTLVEHGPVDGRLFSIEKVRHGQFFGIGGDMPPFSLEVLPDQDLANVLSFLGY